LLRSNWAVARREEGASPQWAVTDEQRSHSSTSAQPEGRQFFFAETSLLIPYRALLRRAGPIKPEDQTRRLYVFTVMPDRGGGHSWLPLCCPAHTLSIECKCSRE